MWEEVGHADPTCFLVQASIRVVVPQSSRDLRRLASNALEHDLAEAFARGVRGVAHDSAINARLNLQGIDVANFKAMIEKAVAEFPNFQATATTLREVHTSTVNDWGAICWHDGGFFEATNRPKLEILDRVGGGDSFASGLIYGFLTFNDAQKAVEFGAAHGALAMTTPGDTTMATLACRPADRCNHYRAAVAGGCEFFPGTGFHSALAFCLSLLL